MGKVKDMQLVAASYGLSSSCLVKQSVFFILHSHLTVSCCQLTYQATAWSVDKRKPCLKHLLYQINGIIVQCKTKFSACIEPDQLTCRISSENSALLQECWKHILIPVGLFYACYVGWTGHKLEVAYKCCFVYVFLSSH